jgi:hypothetical protein
MVKVHILYLEHIHSNTLARFCLLFTWLGCKLNITQNLFGNAFHVRIHVAIHIEIIGKGLAFCSRG